MDYNMNCTEKFLLSKQTEDGKKGDPFACAETEEALLKHIGDGDENLFKCTGAYKDGTKIFEHNKDVYYIKKINYILLEDNAKDITDLENKVREKLMAHIEGNKEIENFITAVCKGSELVSFRGRF